MTELIPEVRSRVLKLLENPTFQKFETQMVLDQLRNVLEEIRTELNEFGQPPAMAETNSIATIDFTEIERKRAQVEVGVDSIGHFLTLV